MKFIEGRSLRFIVASGANTVVTYIIYLILLQFVTYRNAYTITYCTGILLGYLIQTYWVFRRRPSARTAMAYPMIYILQYFLGLWLLDFFIEWVGINRYLAPLLTLAITLPVVFLMTRSVFCGESGKRIKYIRPKF